MSSNLPKQIEDSVAKLVVVVESHIEEWIAARDPAAFRKMELDVAAVFRDGADEVIARVLHRIVRDPELQAEASAAARRAYPGRYRQAGRRTARVTLLGGKVVSLGVEYLPPNRSKVRRKRRHGQRGPGGTGLYPVLAALGIWFGVTPALAGEVCRQVADSDSVRAGRSALARRGIVLGHVRTLRIVNRNSQRAVEQRQQWLAEARKNPARSGPLAGCRVVVAIDGGRLRERKPAPCGRRRKNGHRRFDTPWREPKQIVIYVIDSRTGAVDQTFCPVYDATLDDCDAVFAMVAGYLKALGAHEASRLIMVGDGAKWLWERGQALAEAVGLPKHKLVEVIDWYHAVEVLHSIAAVRARWTKAQRDRWVKRAKNALYKGDTDRVAQLIDELAVGRRAKEIKKHRDYFVRNHDRMQYAAFEKQHLPLGSGAVESAVRRVVNQRMKACGTFWLEDNAEGMLLLRSYLKCGRIDDLLDWSFAMAASWWDGTLRNFLSSPIFQHVLDRVEIEMAGDEWSLPSFLELIDTPGLFSTRRHHQERAVEYMRSLGSEHLPVLLWLLPHRGEGESESATLADALRHLPSLADRVVVLRNVDELELSSRTTEFGVETIVAAGAKLASYPVCLKRVAKNGPERSLVLDLIASVAGQELDALARAMDARVLAGVRREARQATLPPRRPGFRARVARAVEAREICVRIERHRDALHANHLKTLMLADARPVGDRCRKLGERIALNYNTAPYRSQREGAGTFVTTADELHRLLEGLVAKFVEAVDRQEAKDAGEALLAQVRRDTLRLPVIGAFSAGKTTLINALLGLDLPVAAGPATAVVTEISAGPSWEATTFYRAEIELPLIHCSRRGLDFESWRILTGDERSCGARTVASWMREGIAEDVRLLVPDLGRVARLEKRVLGEPVLRTMLAQRRLTQFKGGRDKVLATLDDMARQNSYTDEAKILRSKLPVRAVIRLRLPAGGAAPHGASVPVEDASTRARLYEHLRQPGVAPRVARVELRVPDRQLDHFTLVDTPGTDSVYVHHREAALGLGIRRCAASGLTADLLGACARGCARWTRPLR